MRTRRVFYPEQRLVYKCEWETCLQCGQPVERAYVSKYKTVQTMSQVLSVAHEPYRCVDQQCPGHTAVLPSARWQQLAPKSCTYGYDVIAQIGYQRRELHQKFEAIQASLSSSVVISVAQVRYMYHLLYQPLLACQERRRLDELKQVAETLGLLLGLDGLMPENAEPQLWVVRELRTGITLLSGWLRGQDEKSFVDFLTPIREQGWPIAGIISDKQKALVPAIAKVFPNRPHGFCQMHYFKNAAQPVADADETMKITLRQTVRDQVGDLIRHEQGDAPGVLTVTGVLPSPVKAEPPAVPESGPGTPPAIQHEHETIVQDLLRRVRYLLTLRARPPFRLGGLEMFEALAEVETYLTQLVQHRTDPQLVRLRDGLHHSLETVRADYHDLRQVANWLAHIADILEPDGKPPRSGDQVRQTVFEYLETLSHTSAASPRLQNFYAKIEKTTLSFAPGLFQCYDVPGLPRTNNGRESEFRELYHRLTSTTGQKGGVRRIIQREGAWELIPHPTSLMDTILAFSQVSPEELEQEQQRVRKHRNRFRVTTRSPKQAGCQLERLKDRWLALPSEQGP